MRMKLISRLAIVAAALALFPRVSLAQNAAPYNLPHVSTRLSTDAFIFQPLGSTKVDYQTRAELFSGYALSPTYPVYNVRTAPYSAVGDGVANDTTAFTSAISDACAAGGGEVYVPAGTYLLTPTIQVPCAGVSIRGESKDATYLKWASNGDGLWFGNATVFSNSCGAVSNLTLTGGNTRTGYSLKFDGCDGGRIAYVNIRGGGNGLGLCTDGILGGDSLQHCNLMRIDHLDILNLGSSVGLRIDGGNDRWFTALSIRGGDSPRTGKIGLSLTKSLGGDIFSGDIVTQDVGVKIAPTGGNVVVWETFSSLYSDTNKTKGWELSGAGSISGIMFLDAWAGTNGNTWGADAGAGTSSKGWDVTTGTALTWIGGRTFNTGGVGMDFGATPTGWGISGSLVSGSGQASSGTLPGIRVASSGWRISSTRSGQAMLTSGNTQTYGLEVSTGADNYTVSGNDFRTNVAGGVLNTPGLTSTRTITANQGASMDSYAITTGSDINSSSQVVATHLSSPLPVAQGGLNLSAATDDNVPVGNGTTWQSKALPVCTDTSGNHLNYDTATNAFSCGTSSAASTLHGITGSEYSPDRIPTSGTSAACTDSFVGAAEQGTWRWGNQGSSTQSLAQDTNLLTIANETTSVHARWCTPPAGTDWSFAVKSSCALSTAASNFGGGIAVLETGSEATPTAISLVGEGGSSASYQTKTSYTSAYSGLTSVTIGAAAAVSLPWYYEVRYVDSTKAISYWTSGDGMTWYQLTSRTLGAAPISLGLFVDSNTASGTGLSCRYFFTRLVTSATGAIGQ